MCAQSFSRVIFFLTLWTVGHQALLSMEFSQQEYWSGLPFPSPGDLPETGIEPGSPALEANSLLSECPGMGYMLLMLLLLSFYRCTEKSSLRLSGFLNSQSYSLLNLSLNLISKPPPAFIPSSLLLNSSSWALVSVYTAFPPSSECSLNHSSRIILHSISSPLSKFSRVETDVSAVFHSTMSRVNLGHYFAF